MEVLTDAALDEPIERRRTRVLAGMPLVDAVLNERCSSDLFGRLPAHSLVYGKVRKNTIERAYNAAFKKPKTPEEDRVACVSKRGWK